MVDYLIKDFIHQRYVDLKSQVMNGSKIIPLDWLYEQFNHFIVKLSIFKDSENQTRLLQHLAMSSLKAGRLDSAFR